MSGNIIVIEGQSITPSCRFTNICKSTQKKDGANQLEIRVVILGLSMDRRQ